MLHELIKIWFEWVSEWGYLGVFILMALESTIVPVPSEIVLPPAAYWAAQGQMNFWGVVLAGTLGSYCGSIVSYYFFRWVGVAFAEKYGRYFGLTPEKIRLGHNWAEDFGAFGIFLARLMPVVRHLISIPAGFLRMNVAHFSIATFLGSGFWCTILAWFGAKTIGQHPELLTSPDTMIAALKKELGWFAVAMVLFAILYVIVISIKRRKKS
jgi:membrane protein DedA with SNARE-associated domain